MKKIKSLSINLVLKYSKDPNKTLFNLYKYIKNNQELLSSCYSQAKAEGVSKLVGEKIRILEGDIAECGVYRAGGTIMIAKILKDKKIKKRIYGFDSFEGMPEATEKDTLEDGNIFYKKGILNTTSLGYVEEKIKYFKVDDIVEFVKGYFEDTIPYKIKNDQKFCIVIIDPDQYSGTKFCLNFFYDKVVKNGIIILDDYYLPSKDFDTPGVKKAVDEFLADKAEKPIHLADSMYYIIKQ